MNPLPDGYELHVWQPAEVERFWNFVSRAQPDVYFSHRVGRNVAWYSRDLLASGSRVVDYGCGTGRFLHEVLEYDCRAAGFDTSVGSVEVTNSALGDRANFDGAFSEVELERHVAEFNVAFCLEVVEHLYDDMLTNVLSQLQRLLRPGGTLVVSTPDDEDLSASWICNPTTGTVFHRWQHVRSWTGEALSERLDASGFRTTRVESVHAEALGRDPRSLVMRAGFATLKRGSARTLLVRAERVAD